MKTLYCPRCCNFTIFKEDANGNIYCSFCKKIKYERKNKKGGN